MRWVVKYHYLHRKSPCSFAFALYDKATLNDLFVPEMIGVCIYGTPPSACLRQGICGKDERNNVIELNRLYIHDIGVKNLESFFITQTMRKVNKEIIVSFADPVEGHVGTVYQACSWIYTGKSEPFKVWEIEGWDAHNQTITDKYTAEELRSMGGKKVDVVQKHRYVYFNCGSNRRRQLLRKLKYDIHPYPKKED